MTVPIFDSVTETNSEGETCQFALNEMGRKVDIGRLTVFRWFKFILGHLGHFLLDFLAQIWTQGTLTHILGPILVIFEICQFLDDSRAV